MTRAGRHEVEQHGSQREGDLEGAESPGGEAQPAVGGQGAHRLSCVSPRRPTGASICDGVDSRTLTSTNRYAYRFSLLSTIDRSRSSDHERLRTTVSRPRHQANWLAFDRTDRVGLAILVILVVLGALGTWVLVAVGGVGVR